MLVPVLALVGAVACDRSEPPDVAAGAEKTAKTEVLEAGAVALQPDAPVDALDIHLVGFHPMVDDPSHQMTAHHFCRQVNEDLAQCALFDGDTSDANLTGVEYIVSEQLFETLPEAERQYWHPHNYEILSGQLVAPRLPERAEREFMEQKMNSYGKTWHFWMTGGSGIEPQPLPLGEPHLAWSFNRDGEADPRLAAERDERYGIDSMERRSARQELVPHARPQEGVDRLKDAFPGPTQSIPGVVDRGVD